ncbi:MAG TPA: hypothetical protein VII23_05240 [Terriglobales bacterium]|jgi:hypothetical protein
MGDTSRGLYNKFRVERVDGSSVIEGKHFGCSYFVLDVTHDPFALDALEAYALKCEGKYPLLAADIRGLVAAKRYGSRKVRETPHHE